MRKKVSAIFRTCVLAAFVPALALSLVACEPEDNEPDTEMVETGGKGDDATGSDHPESDAEGEGSTPGTDTGDEGGSPEGPVAVDLGLSVKWASCNVGASSPEGYGDYFAWGETTTKSDYSSDNSITFGLYTPELESRGIINADGNLTAAYDAATVNWGNDWRMPTLAEIKELLDCTWEWTSVNDVRGYRVIGSNGNFIFLPAAGYLNSNDNGMSRRGMNGYYWSASLYSGFTDRACYLNFYYGYYDWKDWSRPCGRTVRPVTDK